MAFSYNKLYNLHIVIEKKEKVLIFFVIQQGIQIRWNCWKLLKKSELCPTPIKIRTITIWTKEGFNWYEVRAAFKLLPSLSVDTLMINDLCIIINIFFYITPAINCVKIILYATKENARKTGC